MSSSSYALFASLYLFDQEVEEVVVPSGKPLRIGHRGQIVVPVPEGLPFLVHAQWQGADQVEVEDGRGERHRLGADEELTLGVGDLEIHLSVVRQARLKRTQPFPWQGSVTLFAAILGLTLFVSQGSYVWMQRCAWFGNAPFHAMYPVFGRLASGLQCPTAMASGADGINAEYLARLLREDYEGSDNGVIEMEIEEKERSYEFIYMPAGADGPKDNMEGAEEVAPEPIRTPETEPAAAPPKVDSNELPELAIDDGTPIPEREELEASEKEESLGLDDNPEAEAGEALETPAEEEEGWGIQDWLDASVDQREDKEIDLMIDMAEERLRIDPDDPEALGILAYYQYLDESFDEATSTFDRLIDLFPDESFGYNNKALVYKRQKLYRKEEGLYRIALALNPEDTTALNNLAVNLGHQRRFDEALHYMKILEAATPDDAYADLHRAKIYAEMGDEELALTFLERALKGMKNLDTLHHIEFRQDIRVDPSFQSLRDSERFRAILFRYYGDDSPLPE